MIPSPSSRLRLALLGGLLGLLTVLLAPASPASAHADLRSSEPANGAVLDTPPTEVVLTFSESVRLVPDRVLVVGPDGDRVDLGQPRAEGEVLTIPLGDAGARGTYLVSFRVISADSHPVPGGITFSIGAPSETPALPVAEGDDPVVKVAVSVTKYLGYAGLVLLVGPALMLAVFWPRRLSRAGVVRTFWCGLGLVGLSTVAAIWVQVPYVTGSSLFEVSGTGLRDVLGGTFGTAHLVRLGVLGAVAVLARPLLAARASRSDLVLLGGLGVVGLGTWPFSGHAYASPMPPVSIAVGTIHLAAAAFWVGGLTVLVGFLLRRADERELSAILPTWSRWAALAVSWLLVAGVVLALLQIGSLENVVTTWYGRLLLVKIGLVGVVISVAAYSRRLVRGLEGARRPRTMRLAVGAEAAVLAVVLVVASVLVQTTPGRSEGAPPAATATDYAATLESPLYVLEVLIEPGKVGSNTVHLYAYTPQREPLRVEEWSATAALPAAGIEPIEMPLLQLTDNHAFGDVSLPVAGEWELRFTLRISRIDQASVSATMRIS